MVDVMHNQKLFISVSSFLGAILIYGHVLNKVLPTEEEQKISFSLIVLVALSFSVPVSFFLKDVPEVVHEITRPAFLGLMLVNAWTLLRFGGPLWTPFSVYALFLVLFHYSEYFFHCLIQPPRKDHLDSYLLNHSKAYGIALVVGWVEYGLEVYFMPSLKSMYLPVILGVCLCTIGEILRKSAMVTAGRSFHHVVQTVKQPEHVLITWGVFSFCRHPSYLGWFLWSLGSQVILFNPVCMVIYPIVSWQFFSSRIYHEEYTLLKFFGEGYSEYQNRVPTGLPFIAGFKQTDLRQLQHRKSN
ncbi:unnamed protein product [Cyprideis torosa]|uniref:Protein-S-isoprenylcysteine O-methyltransferase n=1 Tax=Cyprideis torosa TaxID=163714 RepID=A0A7R8WGL8_9CRUS|nr:unnamed protein product [Cyprideis torosa]CAG0892788.1 unnamed protein product [Cyprideis torosa]